MTLQKTPPLALLYARIAERARATGRDTSLSLKGGARLCVRIVDGVTTLSIARVAKPVGDVELQTFRLACQIPPEATRWPAAGQHQRTDDEGRTHHQIVYRWKTE